MKNIWLALSLVFLVACNEEEPSWDDLSAAEQTSLRNRSQTECLNETNSHFSEFKSTSETNFFTNSGYSVNTTFNYTLKQGSGDTAVTIETHKITIWKIDTVAQAVYLLIEIDASTDEYQFVKVPLLTNQTMIDDLQSDLCDRSATRDTTFTLDTGAKTYRKVSTTSSKETTSTYTYAFGFLAYFSRYEESRTEQPLDSEGNYSGSSTSFSGTLSSGAVETGIPEYSTYAAYVATGTRTSLCILDIATYPYTTDCDPSTVAAAGFTSAEL